jgi:hypothetical protein
MAATFYGSDTGCLDDLPLISVDVSAPYLVIGQRLARRLQTPRGALAFINDDPNGGLDLRQYVNAKVTPNFRALVQAEVKAECEKDEEVLSADVEVSFVAETLTVTIRVTANSGPFALVLTVRELTVEAIFSFNP